MAATTMDWNRLVSDERLGDPQSRTDEFKSPFQLDYDRIAFCAAFRRLQDKTQVFPLPKTAFVRTRLTHSIEVSCVARNLGTTIGRRLRKRKMLPHGIRSSDLGNIVAAASLAHDLGNPPFGHSGEAAIQNWFNQSPVAARYREQLTARQQLEFENYEGNAHAFRLVTRLLTPSHTGALRLTFATLAALAKYPIEAHAAGDEFKGKVSAKKFNFFESELGHFEEVAKKTGLLRRPGDTKWWCRHPLAFVCEAADDITYRLVDFEDGYRMACFPRKKTLDALKDVISDSRRIDGADGFSIHKEKVAYLRAVAITQLVEEAAKQFVENHDAILAGTYEESLLDRVPSAPALKVIQELTTKKVYTDPRVLGVEVAGFKIIYELLECFAGAAIDDLSSRNARKPTSVQSRKILGLVPDENKRVGTKSIKDPYQLLLGMTDFVAGMTDSYAVDFFQRITGQKFVT